MIAVTDEDGFDVSDNAAHVANANPFRYRGYYYDAEIGMYYLQSRYYDPVVGRFINGDDVNFLVASANNNVYSYCNNNPCNMNDEFGYISISLKPYRNKNWLTKLAYSILPSVYIGGYSKEIPIINRYCLKLDIVYTFFSLQTSASAYLGFLLDKEKVEMSAFIPVWGSWPFIGSWAAAFSIGASWTYTYICIAILYSCGDYLYAGIGLKLSVSNLALAAVSLACLAVPYLNAFYVKCMTLVANTKRAAATLGAIVTIASKLCPSC